MKSIKKQVYGCGFIIEAIAETPQESIEFENSIVNYGIAHMNREEQQRGEIAGRMNETTLVFFTTPERLKNGLTVSLLNEKAMQAIKEGKNFSLKANGKVKKAIAEVMQSIEKTWGLIEMKALTDIANEV